MKESVHLVMTSFENVLLAAHKYTVELGLKTRIKETFGYKKRFHSSAFMQDKLSTLIGSFPTKFLSP